MSQLGKDAVRRWRPALAVAFAWLSLATGPAPAQQRGTRPASPEFLVIDLDGDGFCFSPPGQGVMFRFQTGLKAVRTAWTCANRDDAFVAIDVTKNGRVDGIWELVGGHAGPQNGFEYLRGMDGRITGVPGRIEGIADRRIDAADSIYATLILWSDRNHNGVSEESELQSAEYAGVVSIGLDAKTVSEVAGLGSVITRRGTAAVQRQGQRLERAAVTVKLARDADSAR